MSEAVESHRSGSIARALTEHSAITALPEHIPALDGIRGLALMMVLLYHTTHIGIANALDAAVFRVTLGGWCGVDLFFILSGFLITGILLESRDQQHYFRNFYARRFLRISVLYYLVIAICLALSYLPHLQALFPKLPHGGLIYWFYISNLFYIRHPVLGVTWSLAIEEQFYLLWPLFVWHSSRRALTKIAITALLLAVISRCLMLHFNVEPTFIRIFTLSKFDALSMGSLLAIAMRSYSITQIARWSTVALTISSISMIIYVIWQQGLWSYTPGMLSIGLTLLAFFFTSLIAVAISSQPRWLVTLFALPFLTTVGRYSYAMYLLHSPLDGMIKRLFTKTGTLPPLLHSNILMQLVYWTVITLITLAAAWVSWNILEKRCLSLKRYFGSERPLISNARSAG